MKIIRSTITVEVPYENELMNYGDKLNKKLKQIIADTDFIPHETEAGELAPSKRPVIRHET
jgi:DNA polymerase IIIc chi subunit